MFYFGPFELDPKIFLLKRDGEPVPLQRRTLDLLIYLLEQDGRVVSKEELLEKVWLDVSVSEGAVGQAMHHLKRALGRSADSWVTNVRGRGYRFCGHFSKAATGKVAERCSLELPTSSDPEFVGRKGELLTILGAASGAKSKESVLVTVWGEPGIGKTRLLDVLGTSLAHAGFEVLSGQAREEGGIEAYGHWRNVGPALLKDPGVQLLIFATYGPPKAEFFRRIPPFAAEFFTSIPPSGRRFFRSIPPSEKPVFRKDSPLRVTR